MIDSTVSHPIKLIFFANKEFFRFFWSAFEFVTDREKIIDCEMTKLNTEKKKVKKKIIGSALGVNFIKILFQSFSYKSALCRFSLIKVWLCDFLAKYVILVKKLLVKC